MRRGRNQPVRQQGGGRRLPTARAAAGSLCLLLLAAAPAARAAEDPVELGRRALRKGPYYPWYDEQTDGVRTVRVQPLADPGDHRFSRWARSPNATTRGLPRRWTRFWKTVRVLVWVSLGALALLLVWALVRAYLRWGAPAGAEGDDEQDGEPGRAERVEKLPFRIRAPKRDLLAEARRCYEEGRYREAVVYLFSYELLELDRRRLIRLARGRTNRQLIGQLAGRSELAAIVEQTMLAFEDVFFGGRDLDRESFERCWREVDRFHRLADQQAAA